MLSNQSSVETSVMEETYVPDNFRINMCLLESDLSAGAKLTYSVLACCCGGRDYVWPSQDFLAKRVSSSVRTVQRYLKELATFGLIKIGKEYIKGKIRTIYIFLNHALVTFESKEPPKRVAGLAKKSLKTTDESTPKSTKTGDKNNAVYNKDESIKENNIPPTPQTEENQNEAELLTADADSGEGAFFQPGVNEENSKVKNAEEDPAWSEVKKILSEKLSEFNLNAWIQPIICEKSEYRAVLRLPNDIFLQEVKKRFGDELKTAFKVAGIPELSFELLTAEQQVMLAEKARAVAKKATLTKEMAAHAAAANEKRIESEIDILPPESQFDLLYSAYPVKKEREKAEKIFFQKHKKGELPPMTELFKSIKEHQDKDRWWREKMPPLLCNWLANKKWQDKPYE